MTHLRITQVGSIAGTKQKGVCLLASSQFRDSTAWHLLNPVEDSCVARGGDWIDSTTSE